MGGWHLEHTYADLPALFYSDVKPTPVRDPRFVVFNRPLADSLGLDVDALDSAGGAEIFGGNRLPEGSRPIAQAYAGHQFGYFTPLGDGRAILLGEQLTPDGRRVDIQLKGAGQTPYSRRGDGRAALGPMLRELIVSEAMHALGIPTTRSLAVVVTGEPVYRERTLPGAVLTRVAASHLRVGTFQWAAAHEDQAALEAVTSYTIDRHYPELRDADNKPRALLDAVVDRQAQLIASWQLVGFVHGVMNTDNMSLAGETIDFGPCAFMDTYHPDTVFSSIDTAGRYAYGNQPGIAQWNLARLAETLIPLLAPARERAIEEATAAITSFADRFTTLWRSGLRAKIGLFDIVDEDDQLVDELLTWMQNTKADFTETFRRLSSDDGRDPVPGTDAAFRDWHQRWLARLARQGQAPEKVRALMRRHNPAVIARNHQTEAVIAAATDQADLGPLERLLDALAAPYDYDRPRAMPLGPPAEANPSYRTFCGT